MMETATKNRIARKKKVKIVM